MTMPPGKYYIGDPQWDEFCGLTIVGDIVLDGEFTLTTLERRDPVWERGH